MFMSGHPQDTRSPIYFVHVAIFLIITFGVGFLPPFAQITDVGMKVLGAFLGAIYGWLFIALDWPSLVALLAVGISGYADSTHALLITGWTFQTVPQVLLSYLFAEAIAETQFTTYISNKLVTIKLFRGRPYLLITAIFIAAEIMFVLHCSMAGLFMLWYTIKFIAEKAGYEKHNKFSTIMVPSMVVVFILANFMFPFFPGSIVQIGFFTKGMAALVPDISVSFTGWTLWWFFFTNIYIALWVIFCKYVLRFRFPEIEKLGDELSSMSKGSNKMTGNQKFGLAILLGFLVGMLWPEVFPETWILTQIFAKLGLTGMLVLVLCIMCAYQKKDGKPFITLQGVSKGIIWNIIWLLVATEPLANAFNATECGIMPSIMSAITPILTQISPTMFLAISVIVLGLITQIVHNLILMLVFIPLLCPLYAQMGGNPFVLLMGLVLMLSMALATPAASYTSALMFGEPSMTRKSGLQQGMLHFIFALVLFFIVGVPLGNILMPFAL